MERTIHSDFKVGLLFSLSETTSVTERGQYQAAMLAIDEINKQGGVHGRRIVPFVADIASDPDQAAYEAEQLIINNQVIALIGLYTSACRKRLLPILEKHDVLLLYPAQYEGGEQHSHVLYCGPLPNQQLFDFIPWIISKLGTRIYLVGSHYTYSKETTRHIDTLTQGHNGTIVGESYVDLGKKNMSEVLYDIIQTKPDVIFSTLIGESAIAFYNQYNQSQLTYPIASSVMAETEIEAVVSHSRVPYYSCFPYFSSISSPLNHSFIQSYRQMYGTEIISSAMENTYNSVFLLAEALRRISTTGTHEIRQAWEGLSLEVPQGTIRTASNQHTWHHARIGKVNEQGKFDIVWESKKPIAPIPFVNPEHSFTQFTKYTPLIEQLKKSLSCFSYLFAVFTPDGNLLETFQNSLMKKPFVFPSYEQGTKWRQSQLKQSGMGIALQLRTLSLVKGTEHDEPELHEWVTLGIPIQEMNDLFHGVLGVWIPMSQIDEESLSILRVSLTHITQLSIQITEKLASHMFSYQLLSDLASFTSEYLFVIKEKALVYSNDKGKELLKQDRAFMLKTFKDVDKMSAHEKTIVRKETSGEMFEMTTRFAGEYTYLYMELLSTPRLKEAVKEKEHLLAKDLVGVNDQFMKSVALVRSASKVNANVLLLGESGTGKEMFARAIHNESNRRHQPFVALNCAAISPDLINAELFGYVEGAFTGAVKGGSMGKFEVANGGTLFLDEIGDMPLSLQGTLLRVLQEKEIMRVGGHESIPIDVRIIAATHKNISQEIAYNGSFRGDLYFRLNVFSIELPPLRERKNDIPLLVSHFINELAGDTASPVKRVADSYMDRLMGYHWPGNIRELHNIIERAFYLAESDGVITEEYLPRHIIEFTAESSYTRLPESPSERASSLGVDAEFHHMVDVMLLYNGNISKTAQHLGISRTTLYRKLNEYNAKRGLSTP